VRVCPTCDEQNADRARFCSQCGAPFENVSGADRRERRVVSVLFADLVGFTSRSEHLDVEDVEAMLTRYHRLLRGELERHGGTVEKFIGDAVMALFGAPAAHEDDPERAVRAGLSIQEVMEQLRRRDGVDLHVRVGVTTGEVLVRLGADPHAGEGMASGDVVNTAARLQSAAPADGLLVDETTYRSTDRAINYDAVAAVAAKGKREPVAVWLAQAPRSLLPEQSRVGDLPLVGRDDELSQLLSALGRARREPSTQLVTIIGAPGIGKSRLVEELSAQVEAMRDLVRWRRGRSLAYGESVALWALAEMVKAEAGILESDAADTTAAKLDAMVSGLLVDQRDREWVLGQLRPLVGLEMAGRPLSAEGGRVEAFAAWRKLFEAMAEDGATVLVFEDVHWADEALLEFIDLLAERAGSVPLLIICTARPELLERRSVWGGGKINALTINLTPLSEEATGQLLAALLDQALLPAHTQHMLLTRAEGNPLYALEYVRMLRDRGMLVRDDSGWRLVAEPSGLPESVQGIIASRLDTLTDDERRLVQAAAVVGRTAWLGAVCAVDETSPRQAEEALHRLERKQLLVRSRRSSVAREMEFSFTHAVTQEVAYAQIPRLERANKHQMVAGWIEKLAGERDDKAELLAYHYQTALQLRIQAGEDVATLVATARSALIEAGQQAEAVNAHATAARHFCAALELSPVDDPVRPRLLLDHATAAIHAGDTDELTLRAALDANVAIGDWEAAAQASLWLSGWLEDYAGDGDRAASILSRGMDFATYAGNPPVASLLAHRKAFRLMVTGRAVEAISFTEEGIRRAEEAGDLQGRALLLSWHGSALGSLGDVRGVEEMQEAADSLARYANPWTAIPYHNLAELLTGLGDIRRAVQASGQAASWAERFGQAELISGVKCAEATSVYHLGDWDTALSLAESLIDRVDRAASAWARWTRGHIVLARGDSALALADARKMLDYAKDLANDEVLIGGLALLTMALHASGNTGAAEEASGRLFARWHEIGGLANMAPAIAELQLIPDLHAAVGAAAAPLPEASRWKEALAAIAKRHYIDAVRLYQQIGSKTLEAAARMLAAEDAGSDGRHEDARREAQQAFAFYGRVQATSYADRAERSLRATA
jgi:class 3 adenylate cyclase/MoxR-like ATPase